MAAETRPDIIRVRVSYSGRVQGVGFRYTTLHVSRNYDVVGYVKNMADGTVELEAEGSPAEVERFLAAVRREMSGHIQNEERTSIPPSGRDTQFEIGI